VSSQVECCERSTGYQLTRNPKQLVGVLLRDSMRKKIETLKFDPLKFCHHGEWQGFPQERC
jgi:hypothetical protein